MYIMKFGWLASYDKFNMISMNSHPLHNLLFQWKEIYKV